MYVLRRNSQLAMEEFYLPFGGFCTPNPILCLRPPPSKSWVWRGSEDASVNFSKPYLAASQVLGSASEKPASGKVKLRISPEIPAAAFKVAARSGTSLDKWAAKARGKAARKPSARAVAFQRRPTLRQSRSATASQLAPA